MDLSADDPWQHEREEDPDTAHLMEALGRVVAASAMLEHLLRSVVCSLIGSPYSIITVASMQTGALIEQCRALIKVHRVISDQTARDELADLLGDAARLSQLRNRFVHDVWAVKPGQGMAQLEQHRKSHRMTARDRTYDELARCACDIEMLSSRLGMWRRFIPPELKGIDADLRWLDGAGAMSANDE